MANRNVINHAGPCGVVFSGTFSGPIVVNTSDATADGFVFTGEDEAAVGEDASQ